MDVGFAISVHTKEAQVYYQVLPPSPIPRIEDDVFVPSSHHGAVMGWWKVKGVSWQLPSMGAMSPAMCVNVLVEWSDINNRPAPTYDDDACWVRKDEKES